MNFPPHIKNPYKISKNSYNREHITGVPHVVEYPDNKDKDENSSDLFESDNPKPNPDPIEIINIDND